MTIEIIAHRSLRAGITDRMAMIHESTFSDDLTGLLLQGHSDYMKLYIFKNKYAKYLFFQFIYRQLQFILL